MGGIGLTSLGVKDCRGAGSGAEGVHEGNVGDDAVACTDDGTFDGSCTLSLLSNAFWVVLFGSDTGGLKLILFCGTGGEFLPGKFKPGVMT